MLLLFPLQARFGMILRRFGCGGVGVALGESGGTVGVMGRCPRTLCDPQRLFIVRPRTLFPPQLLFS